MDRYTRIELREIQCSRGRPRRLNKVNPQDGPGRCGGTPNAAVVADVQRASVTCKAKSMGIYMWGRAAGSGHVSPGRRCGPVCGPDDGIQPRATRVYNRGIVCIDGECHIVETLTSAETLGRAHERISKLRPRRSRRVGIGGPDHTQ